MIQEVDYIELPAKKEPSRPAFEREKVESSTFTTTAWFLSNFGKMAHHVWWGYKVGYYVIAFPCIFLVAFAVDFICIIARLSAYLARRLFDLLLSSMQTATKLIITAAAVILVVMYVYNNGLDGMLSDYKKLCEWLVEYFAKSH